MMELKYRKIFAVSTLGTATSLHPDQVSFSSESPNSLRMISIGLKFDSMIMVLLLASIGAVLLLLTTK